MILLHSPWGFPNRKLPLFFRCDACHNELCYESYLRASVALIISSREAAVILAYGLLGLVTKSGTHGRQLSRSPFLSVPLLESNPFGDRSANPLPFSKTRAPECFRTWDALISVLRATPAR